MVCSSLLRCIEQPLGIRVLRVKSESLSRRSRTNPQALLRMAASALSSSRSIWRCMRSLGMIRPFEVLRGQSLDGNTPRARQGSM